ncbi:unnamed protein product [Calicophoron daubneyi]|uniref:Uncharacterized protein n=1 Tax=Calicophoron daubneyi TaxID=300641 RepID=A0AAV2TPJ5_CALDB
MAIRDPHQSPALGNNDPQAILTSIPVVELSSFGGNRTVTRPADYIGSFLVTGKGHHDRAEIVRQKLEAARAYTHSKPILLLISLSGIKVCRDNNEHIYMAHALRRISYATCDPDNLQFAFLAREPKAQPNVQYCHAFVTTTAEEAEELNNIVGEAFRVAYAQQRLAMLTEQVRNAALLTTNQTGGQLPFGPNRSTCPPSGLNTSNNGVTPVRADPAGQELKTAGISPLKSQLSSGHAEGAINSSPVRSMNERADSTANPAVLNKPLPPVPVQDNCSSSSNPPLKVDARTSPIPDEQRERRQHKHHKHHKHRHRHRTKEDDVVVNPDASVDATQLTDDSERFPNMNESTGIRNTRTESSAPLQKGGREKPLDRPHLSPGPPPPPPPPRGPSSSSAAKLQDAKMHSPLVLPLPDFPELDQPCLRRPKTSETIPLVDEDGRLVGDANARVSKRPLSETCKFLAQQTAFALHKMDNEDLKGIEHLTDDLSRSIPEFSRPQSQHSYDMADHRSCGAIPVVSGLDSTDSGIVDGHDIISPSSAVTTLTVSATTTTTSSSTTGCSTATSGSALSGSGSGGSLPGPRRAAAQPVSSSHNGGDTRSCGSAGSRPSSMRHSHRIPTPSNPMDNRGQFGDAARISDPRLPPSLLDETVELAQAPWYQPHVPREVALEILSRQPPGSFVIRDSGSHANCYALSVRFGEGAGRCSVSLGQSPMQQHPPSGLVRGRLTSTRDVSGLSPASPAAAAAYPFSMTGISHFLIQRTARGGVKLKGLDKEWPSISCLVLHLTVMPEMLPCPLRLPKAAANPVFSPVDGGGGHPHPPNFEQAPGPFCPIQDAVAGGRLGNGSSMLQAPQTSLDEDEDYQRLSDFSSIMADLKPRLCNSRSASNASRSRPGCRGR